MRGLPDAAGVRVSMNERPGWTMKRFLMVVRPSSIGTPMSVRSVSVMWLTQTALAEPDLGFDDVAQLASSAGILDPAGIGERQIASLHLPRACLGGNVETGCASDCCSDIR